MKVNLTFENRKKSTKQFHECMNYILMQGWELTIWLTMKANTEINYESKYEINYYKTWNYTASEKSN